MPADAPLYVALGRPDAFGEPSLPCDLGFARFALGDVIKITVQSVE